MAAFVNGGFGKTASIIKAPTHTSAVGAGALMRVLCIVSSKMSITWLKE